MGGEIEPSSPVSYPIGKDYKGMRKDMTDMEEVCKGDPAWEGEATGIVRLIYYSVDSDGTENHNFDEFVDGEILVTNMTDIAYVPTMRRAAAIITGVGGVLCHAAIISRELDKPCIVGIRDGIHSLNTGDHITVNATDGIVYRKKA